MIKVIIGIGLVATCVYIQCIIMKHVKSAFMNVLINTLIFCTVGIFYFVGLSLYDSQTILNKHKESVTENANISDTQSQQTEDVDNDKGPIPAPALKEASMAIAEDKANGVEEKSLKQIADELPKYDMDELIRRYTLAYDTEYYDLYEELSRDKFVLSGIIFKIQDNSVILKDKTYGMKLIIRVNPGETDTLNNYYSPGTRINLICNIHDEHNKEQSLENFIMGKLTYIWIDGKIYQGELEQ